MTATLTDSPKATPKVASTQLLPVETPPHRALLRYFGGKWRIAPWVIEHLPPHRIYVEPFGGAASVLLRKPRSAVEVYNDLDDEIVHLMRTVQHPASCQQLMRRLRRTPYARREFERAFEPCQCPITRAQRTVVRAFQSFHHEAVFNPKKTTFADALHRAAGRSSKAHEWAAYPRALAAIRRRLQGVIIENRDALQVLRVQDTSETLFFVDPPYLPSTRSKSGYRCELSTDQHIELLHTLRGLKGMVVLAGYPSDLYDEMLGHWHRVQRPARAAGSTRVRTEVLWINPAAIKSRESAALKPPMG